MSRTSQRLLIIYLAFALIMVGVQLPIRLQACSGLDHCLASLTRVPVWGLFWPLYGLVLVLPPIAGQVVAYVGVPLATAVLIAVAWKMSALKTLFRYVLGKIPREYWPE